MAKKKQKKSSFRSAGAKVPTWNVAMAQLQGGQLPQAKQSFLAILQQQPHSAECYQMLGVIAHRQGSLADAIAAYQQAIALKSDYPEAYNNLGAAFWQSGHPTEAIAAYQQAVTLKPEYADALGNLGTAWLYQGELENAIAVYQRALSLAPNNPDIHNNLGSAFRKTGNFAAARQHFEQAFTLKPNYAQPYHNLANLLRQQEDLTEALKYASQAVRLDPSSYSAYNNLGAIHKDQGNRLEAIAAYQQALRLQPNAFEPHSHLGELLIEQGELEVGIGHYQTALSLKSDLPEVYNNLGAAYKEQGEIDKAIACYQRAIALKPDFIEAYNNLGVAFLDQNQFEAALAQHHQALSYQSEDAETYRFLGNLWLEWGKVEDAIAHYRQALVYQPDDALIHSALGTALLALGDLSQGFAEYEWRWKTHNIKLRPCTQPFWEGNDLQGKTILLHAEQGFGDTIQFIRYAPLVAQKGEKVIVECYPALVRLFETVAGVEAVIAVGKPVPEFDVHAPLMSLPHLLGTTIETIPADVPYLGIGEVSYSLPTQGLKRLKVGMVWDVNRESPTAKRRACGLSYFQTLLDLPEISWFSLQKGSQATQVITEPRIQDLSSQLGDFADTAAIIAQLDLIITVDTAVAHLAGALGKPVWLLLSYSPDWRWLLERQDSPWYPTMRLFRQTQPGDWQGVFAQVKVALAQWANVDLSLAVSTLGNLASIEVEMLSASSQPSVISPESNYLPIEIETLSASSQPSVTSTNLPIKVETLSTSSQPSVIASESNYLPIEVETLSASSQPSVTSTNLPIEVETLSASSQPSVIASDSTNLPIEVETLSASSQPSVIASDSTNLPIKIETLSASSQPSIIASESNYLPIEIETLSASRQLPQFTPQRQDISEQLTLAQQHHLAGRLHQAVNLYEQIISIEPNCPEAFHSLGCIAQQAGNLAKASTYYQQALAVKPDYAETYNNLGVLFWLQGAIDASVAAYRRAVEYKPDYAEAYNNLGVVLWRRGESQEAIDAYRQAIALKPEYIEAYNNLGAALRSSGAVADAIALYQQALKLRPDCAEVYNNLAIALKEQNRLAEAVTQLRQAIQIKPNYAEAYHNLGDCLQQMGQFDEALFYLRQAIGYQSDYVEAYNRLGNILQQQGKLSEAIVTYERAIQIKPDYVKAYNNLAHTLEKANRLSDAIACFNKVLELEPDYSIAHFGRAFTYLLMGDFLAGFAEYEWRWRMETVVKRNFKVPRWQGLPLQGQTILLHAEQGLGDAIQFIRYAPSVKAKGGKVWVECHSSLIRLFQSVAGIDRLIPTGEELPDFDVYAPLLSLPHLFQTTLESIPAEIPYLGIETQPIQLASDSTFKIGVVWKGQPAYECDRTRNRSCPIELILPLSKLPGITLYSLQKESLTQLSVSEDIPIADLSQQIGDFADTAAIIAQLDLVITIDTSVAHLAGAMGKPVWVVLPYAPDWRWMRDCHTTPWYPTMRLFRQPQPGDWQAVFSEVRVALAELTAQPLSETLSPQTPSEQIAAIIEHYQARRLEEAEALCWQLLQQQANSPEAQYWLGLICAQTERVAEAIHYYQQVLAAYPNSSEVHHNLGVAYHRVGNREAALASYRTALQLEPNSPEIHNSLGVAIQEIGKISEASQHFQEALRLNPTYLAAYYNLGNSLLEQGQPQQALSYYNHFITHEPHSISAYWNRALTYLISGNFQLGFVEYEWRWRQRGMEPPFADKPLWDGSPLQGKTILLYTEQGFGDAIQFIRYVSLVQAKGGKIFLQCPSPLIRLFSSIPGISGLIVEGETPPEFDVQAPIMSLPRILGTTLETIPANIPYLGTENGQILDSQLLKIGITWSCGQTAFQALQFQRSCPLSYFWQLLAIAGIELYSLQRDIADLDFVELQRYPQIQDLSHRLVDFAETAAMIAPLDLIITVDTAIAHLAGAMGKTVWVLLPYSPDWRWMLYRHDTPWYPTMRLFRQSQPGDWQSVFDKVKVALEEITRPKEVSVEQQAAAFYHQGCQAHQLGNFDRAIALYQSAIALKPEVAALHRNMGIVLKQQGKLTQAIAAYRQALAVQPDYIEAYLSLGIALREQGQLEEALLSYQAALEIQPNFPPAYNNQGNIYQQLGHWQEAIQAYQKAIALQPNYPEALMNLGTCLQENGQFTEAEQYYHQVLTLRPGYANAYCNLGVVLHHQQRWEEAIAHYHQAITLEPENAFNAYNNLGLVLQEQDKIVEAESCYRQAISQSPNYADAHHNLGVVLMKQCRLEEAIVSYQTAIALKPNFVDPHLGLAMTQLLAGNLQAGFREYEWRWQVKDNPPQHLAQPLWEGSSLVGKTILLYSEQGFGDTIQFIRYIPLVKAKGGRIVVDCQKPLIRLFADIPEIDILVARGEKLPPFDVQAPLLSLPGILGTTLETIPAEIPYLGMEIDSTQASDSESLLKIGLVWAGSPSNKSDRTRSCQFSQFQPLFEVQDLEFYSLQKGPTELKQQPETFGVKDLAEDLADFFDTAKAIANLDLIITVDTAVAHLAGAMGKPVWLLLSFSPDWRWLLNREDSPWYPTLRLFRQTQMGDWETVIQRVRKALRELTQPQDLATVSELLNQAFAHHQAGKFTAAQALYQQILEIQPDCVEAIQLLGTVTHQLGNTVEAIALLRQALTLNPNYAEAYNNLGAALWQHERSLEAIECYEKAIALKPDYIDAYHNLGIAQRYHHQPHAAIAAYQRAISLKPDHAEAYNHLGLAYRDLNQIESAIAHYQHALQLKPNYAEAHLNLAFALLLQGNLQQGFLEYEWRWQQKGFVIGDVMQQFWDGSPLNGRTLLLRAEQGFGDTLQFIRYAPLIKAQGGRAILECQSPLVRLLKTAPGIDQIVSRGEEALPPFDVQAPLLSLPRILGTTLENLPADVPYLPVKNQKTLDSNSTLKIGIVWAGSPHNKNDRQRSCDFQHFKPLLNIPGITFYSLQKGPRVAEIDGEYPNLISLDTQLNDFADTAEIIAQLDLIMTVDTAVAHLAGAMGKPVWLLLCFSPDWRWLLNREDSPWYPTLRLFRQTQPGDWSGVFTQVGEALRSRVEPAKPPETLTSVQRIGIGWPIGLATGWGVYGMNLALQLLKRGKTQPVLLMSPSQTAQQMNPLHLALLQPALQAHQVLQSLLSQHENQQAQFEFPVLHALGNQCSTSEAVLRLRGSQTLGVIFFEDTHFTPEAIAKAKTYDRIIAGSTWNANILKGYGLTNVSTVFQGIDNAIFHPAPQANWFCDRFVIFSGGKLEYRKGQDIVIAAFKRFQQRHPEALLVTAWHNFWPQFMAGLEQTGNVVGLPQISPEKRLQITPWLVENGIPADAIIDVGLIPNHLVGQILREADVAVFPNRAEGGTNLAAMESLACGVPTILSANTGHLDLIGEAHCYPLKTQNPVQPTSQFQETEGWGESSVDEVVELLEQVYQNREIAQQKGIAAAQFMQNFSWEKQVSQFLQIIQ